MRYTKLTSLLKQNLVVIAVLGLCSAMSAHAVGQSSENRLLNVLASDASTADKCNACRELQTAGTEESISALAMLLTDPSVSHTARMALEVMPYAEAGEALREAAGKTSGLTKSGIIDSLGERRDVEALPILAAALTETDHHVQSAAAAALAKIGTAEAAGSLALAYAKPEVDDRSTIGLALVRCADRLFAAGKREEASAIYAKLSEPTEPRVVRVAALRGRLQAAGPGQTQAIARALADDDPLIRQAAAGQLRNLSDQAFRELAAKTKMGMNMSDLSADAQVAMLAAIRIRQDKSLASVVLQAAGSNNPVVQVTAIEALEIVGDVSALPLLMASSAQDDAGGKAARHSLQLICDPQVDERIAAVIRDEKDPVRRAGWIGVIEARRPAGAVELLLEEATHDHPQVRNRAMAALANLAGPKDITAMVPAVLRAEKGAERDSAEKAVMLVCQQVHDPERRAEPVINILKGSSPAERVALLPLLGRIGGSDSRRELQVALNSGEADLYSSGVRAICNWPDASAAEQLLALSEKAELAAHRLSALRAFIRVIALPSDLPDAQKLVLLKQAMERAERDDERNLVLQRASAIRTVEALRFLLPYLDQPSLVQTAGASITELGRHKELRDPNKADFIPALEKVLETNKDHGTLENARRYIQAAKES